MAVLSALRWNRRPGVIEFFLGGKRMKKLYNVLKIMVWCFIGVFIGSSIYRYYDYTTHPALYAWQSAPWYLSIGIWGIFTAVLVAVILIVMVIIKKKLR